MTRKISWLHLSDLHIGQSFQWLWPNFKTLFLEDLERLAGEAGPLDLVLFSGDLTQRGSAEEFASVSNELSDVWELLDKLGQRPVLFPVPGNHDLARPPKNDAQRKILRQWGTDPDVINEFWSGSDNQYIDVVHKAFSNYSSWLNGLAERGIPTPECIMGRIPGDLSASITVDGIAVGLIGLNSSFLQLGDEDYSERLLLDLRQLNALTDNNPPEWCNRHEINFLVTHHPPTWLAPEALRHFNTEISPVGRFTSHFYGHMHDPSLTTVFHGGDAGRKSFQSSSLFGMEFLADGKTERVHGYALGQIQLGDAEGTWKLWPRKARVNPRNGDRRIVQDVDNFDLLPGKEYLEERIVLKRTALASRAVVAATSKPVDLATTVEETSHRWEDILRPTAYALPDQEQHLAIRPLQQQSCMESVRQKRMAWVCADWGLGRDGFLWSVAKRMGRENQGVYRVDLGNYSTRAEFLTSFATTVGCSFPDFCKALTSAGPCILLLDEAPTGIIGDQTITAPEQDAEKLAMMLRDFCPNAIIFLLARQVPKVHAIDVIKLDALDEADTRTYLLAHPSAGNEARSPKGVSEIFRHTDGLPVRIDRALGTLRVVSLAELGPPTGTDLISSPSVTEAIPMSLVNAVSELASSSDPVAKRSWLLLKVLAILQHGESLQRLKRIEHESPIFPRHAEELLERDLIQIRSSTSIIRQSEGVEDQVKILVSPRPVRDYVLSRMSPREIDHLVKKAVSLYFGESWRTGSAGLRKPDGMLISDDGSLLQNPHFLVTRLLATPSVWQSTDSAEPVLGLCRIYCSALLEAKNYRNCAIVCRDVLAIIPSEGFSAHRDTIEIIFAKSLRMLGEHTEARPLYERLLTVDRSKEIKAQLLLNYAMCLQSLGDVAAIVAAKEVMDLVPKTANALHAESIIYEMQEDEDSDTKLLKLEVQARKHGFDTVANNLVLSRTAGNKSTEADNALRQVYTTAAANGDLYTAARATVRLAARSLRQTTTLSSTDLAQLIKAYQYFYGERFDSLFSSAHQSLWNVFERQGDVRNMLSLFRHSSFIWRLHGDDDRERDYIKRLIGAARQILATDVRSADQNTAYFLLRARDHVTDEGKGAST
ncbi:metallophosphoesterase [Burkholderia cepacia]|uniref:metallophosphoesterase n=1 Tax=Burkholderia cepacia TaxID=292 RepID=UPI0012973495|nr:metallophosphoesterase [Burkholderia cepacia]QFS38849.1 Calcineurin-like phosphoestera [Burkholderia cepacia]